GPAEAELARGLEAESNLIPNPGFEEGLLGWKSDFPPIQEDTKIVHSGKKSCKYPVNVQGQSEPLLMPRTLKGVLKPGARYLLRFYVRTESFRCNGKPGAMKVTVDPGGRGTNLDTGPHFPFEASESAWSARRFSFEANGPDLSFAVHTSLERGAY